MSDPRPAPESRGRRILVVEDEDLMAEDLRDLDKVGAEVVGPVPSVADALKVLSQDSAIDGAIPDVDLRGEKAHPVADALRGLGIPFGLATGCEQWALPEAYKDVPHCDKPVDLPQLARTLSG